MIALLCGAGGWQAGCWVEQEGGGCGASAGTSAVSSPWGNHELMFWEP